MRRTVLPLIAALTVATVAQAQQAPPYRPPEAIPAERIVFLVESAYAPITRVARPRDLAAQAASLQSELRSYRPGEGPTALGEALLSALKANDPVAAAKAREPYEAARQAWVVAQLKDCLDVSEQMSERTRKRIALSCEVFATYQPYRKAQLALDAARTDTELRDATRAVDMAVTDNARAGTELDWLMGRPQGFRR